MNSNKPYKRSERVGKQVLDIISSVAIKNIDLSYLGFITFTNVTMSEDLKNAKIFFSVINNELPDKQIEIQINKKQKAFKKFLGNELNLKTIPNIHFYPDDTLAYTEKINHLIKDAGLDTNNSDTKSP